MRMKKRYLYLDEAEYSILIKSLVQMKNKLRRIAIASCNSFDK